MNKNLESNPEHACIAMAAEERIRACINQQAVAEVVSVTFPEPTHQEDELNILPIAN